MNLLFIAPIFFEYEKAIKEELDNHFEKVVFRCEVPLHSSLRYYALKKISKKIAAKVLVRYNGQLVRLLDEEKIDKILVIRGFGLNNEFLNEVKNRGIELVNYQWDSLRNNPNGLVIAEYANKSSSFDIVDCDNNPRFCHIPLFYHWNKEWDKSKNIPKSDLFFVGSYHSGRHLIVQELIKQASEQGFEFIPYIYMPFMIYVRKKLSGEPLNCKNIKFRKLSRKKYFEAINGTKAMLDIQSLTQTGATMRTIETLSLGKKVISTNQTLNREQFFSASNIYFWDGNSPLDIKTMLKTPFDTNTKGLLSITDWVKNIL